MAEESASGILSTNDLVRLADPFAQLMNRMQAFDGENIHDVIAAGLYTLGCALAQTGCYVDIEGSIKSTIGPLSIGYSETKEKIKKKLI